MRAIGIFLLLGALLAAPSTASMAAEIRTGATVQVKPNSIWFENAAGLAQWQKLKTRASADAVAAYERRILRQREAWQFINPLSVKILGHDPKSGRITVEMLTEGRLQGSTWVLDAGTLSP